MKYALCAMMLLTIAINGAELEVRPVEPNSFAVHRAGSDAPLFVMNERPDFRPHIHPINAPDGSGLLTQMPENNYKHHCGLWIGLNNVTSHGIKQGFFYDNTAFHPQPMIPPKSEGSQVKWTVVDDWRTSDKNKPRPKALTETQDWTFSDHATYFVFDLKWTLTASDSDVTFGKADYGGLFVRLQGGARASNSEGLANTKENKQAVEGKTARWLLLEDSSKSRGGKDAYVVIMDHKENPGHPVAWREAGSHIGTSRCKLEEWSLKAGASASAKFRILVVSGKPENDFIESVWTDFVGVAKPEGVR